MGVREVLDVVARDRPFYGGGGGITLSGGEVLVQWEFAAELAKMASETYHLHVAVETTGHGEWERLLAVAKYCDEILYDIKHMDDERHRYGTYAGNALILENLRKLAADAADRIKIRIPLIEGYNADDANIAKVCELGKELGIGEIHLLPYHQFGEPKYAKLGWAYAFDGRTPDDRAVERIRDRLENDGFKVTVGG
jgi:pyruvate formate lyase activating enzyme